MKPQDNFMKTTRRESWNKTKLPKVRYKGQSLMMMLLLVLLALSATAFANDCDNQLTVASTQPSDLQTMTIGTNFSITPAFS